MAHANTVSGIWRRAPHRPTRPQASIRLQFRPASFDKLRMRKILCGTKKCAASRARAKLAVERRTDRRPIAFLTRSKAGPELRHRSRLSPGRQDRMPSGVRKHPGTAMFTPPFPRGRSDRIPQFGAQSSGYVILRMQSEIDCCRHGFPRRRPASHLQRTARQNPARSGLPRHRAGNLSPIRAICRPLERK